MAPKKALPQPIVGSGSVTDTQVAFMVECYLRDNHFSRTLHEFRSEASRILLPLKTVPKGARTLSAVLNDYVVLKAEHMAVASDKARVQHLLQGLQELVAMYQSGDSYEAGAGAACQPAAICSQTTAPAMESCCVPPASSTVTASCVPALASPAENGNGDVLKRKSQGKGKTQQCSVMESPDPAKRPRRSCQPEGSLPMTNLPVHGRLPSSIQPTTPPMNCSLTSQQQQQQQQQQQHQRSSSPSLEKSLASPSPSAPLDCCTPPPSSSFHYPPSVPSCGSLPNASVEPSRRHPRACKTSTLNAHEPSMQSKGHPVSRSHPVNSSSSAALVRPGSAKRAHSFTPAMSTQSARPKLADKKAGSKCRLLDFSSADPKVYKENCPPLSSAISLPSQLEDRPDELPLPDATSITQAPTLAELGLLPDGVSFDDLFNLELDTDLISELEDLSTMDNDGTPPNLCSDPSALVPIDASSSLGVLTERDANCADDLPRLQDCSSGVLKFKDRSIGVEAENAPLEQENNPVLAANR